MCGVMCALENPGGSMTILTQNYPHNVNLSLGVEVMGTCMCVLYRYVILCRDTLHNVLGTWSSHGVDVRLCYI
jgi:hypothetical protein